MPIKRVNMQSIFHQQFTSDMHTMVADQAPPPQATVGHYPQLVNALQTSTHTGRRNSLDQSLPQLPTIEGNSPKHSQRQKVPTLSPPSQYSPRKKPLTLSPPTSPSKKFQLPTSSDMSMPYFIQRSRRFNKANRQVTKMVAKGKSIQLHQRDRSLSDTRTRSPTNNESMFVLADEYLTPCMPFLLPRDGGPRQPAYRRLSQSPAQRLGKTRRQLQEMTRFDYDFSRKHADMVYDRVMGRLGSRLAQQNISRQEHGVSFVPIVNNVLT